MVVDIKLSERDIGILQLLKGSVEVEVVDRVDVCVRLRLRRLRDA